MDRTIVRVKATTRSLRDVLKQACMEERFSALAESVRAAVVLQFAEEHDLSVDEREWKNKINEIRQRKGLYSVAETRAWLNRHGLTQDDLFETARIRLLTEKVKRSVTEARIDAYFYENRLSFDKANLSQLVTSRREQAQELLFRIEEGESFFQLAQTYSTDGGSKYAGGHIGWVGRSDLSGEEESFVFGHSVGQTAGPFAIGSSYRLLHVWELEPAELTEDVRNRIADLLFEEWLDEVIKGSDVEVNLWRELAGEV